MMDENTTDQTKQQMNNAMQMLDNVIPSMGKVLLVFGLNDPKMCNYASNCKREEIITALRNTADRLDAMEDTSQDQNDTAHSSPSNESTQEGPPEKGSDGEPEQANTDVAPGEGENQEDSPDPAPDSNEDQGEPEQESKPNTESQPS